MTTEEKWEIVRARQAGRCYVCRQPMTQLAHVLPRDKLHYSIYGRAIIDHPDNVRGVCGFGNSTPCNAKVQINTRAQPIAAAAHAQRIRQLLKEAMNEDV